MGYKDILKETLNLLYWAMLAATTVGPGTVVTCARAGAEYQMHLIWALIFASILAYILLEGTARLTIISGKSLGECLQLKYSHGRKIWNVGILGWVVTVSVYIGNTLFEFNCFAGGMAAIYILPPVENTLLIRLTCCAAYAIIVIAILYADKVNLLGIGLGIVTVSMVILFLILVIRLGVDMERFGKGLIPISMPHGSINIVLSLIATTSLGFNLFLGSEMARGYTLPRAQRGIAFSTVMAFCISVLILIVGDGTHARSKGVFTIASLGDIIERLSGKTGTWVFGIGFIAAALSSMLTVPLGAAVTADSILTINSVEKNCKSKCDDENQQAPNKDACPDETTDVVREEFDMACTTSPSRPLPKKYYKGMMFVMVIMSAIVIAANTPRVLIILIAQVFNGCLLPFFSICLLICINDQQFMGQLPQKGWSNCCLIICVWITLFLTGNTIIQNAFSWTVSKHYTTVTIFQLWNFIISAIFSVVIMLMLFFLTDLGKNIKKSFCIFFKRNCTVVVTPADMG